MTVLSHNLLRKMIIQEMRMRIPRNNNHSNTSTFNDEKTLDIDRETEIDALPDFMKDFDDETLDVDYETEFDFDSDIRDFGVAFDDDDSEFEFESETEEDSESETEYNQFGQLGISGQEIRKRVMDAFAELSLPNRGISKKTRAEMQYDDLVRQGKESEMPDPEFMDSDELDNYGDTAPLPSGRKSRRPQLSEHINKRIRQSIRRQMLLL